MASNEKRKLDNEKDQLQSVTKQRKLIGPSLPLPEQAADATSEADSEDDDDFGPSLPPSDPLGVPVQVEPSVANIVNTVDLETKESQRDQWMLQPPSHSDWASKIDPTQLRNRKFNTGKSATVPQKMDSAWVETPDERMKRLQDAVMGIGSSSCQTPNQTGTSTKKAMEDQIKKYKETTGGNVRLEKQTQGIKEDDDPSGRAFDREKDMALSSKITAAQRREMVKKAADYNTRFTKGNYL